MTIKQLLTCGINTTTTKLLFVNQTYNIVLLLCSECMRSRLLVSTIGSSRAIRRSRSKLRPFNKATLLLSAAIVVGGLSSSLSSFPHYFAAAAMSTHTTERDGSGTITVSPKNEATQSGLVVICHGLGDTAEGFADVAEQLAMKMPHLKFILPTAPTQPVTMNMGMPMPSWYDIVGLDERSNENCKGLQQSRERVEQIIQNEHTTTKLPYSRMVLAGFSQGGALSLYTGLQLDEALAGIVVMSGYLPAAKSCKPKQWSVPIYHGHGTMDPMVQYPLAEKTKEKLTSLGIKSYTLESFPIQHTVSPQELQSVMKFIAKVLPPDDSCRIELKPPKEMSVKELKAAIRKAGLGSKAVGLMEKSEFIKLLEDHRAGKL